MSESVSPVASVVIPVAAGLVFVGLTAPAFLSGIDQSLNERQQEAVSTHTRVAMSRVVKELAAESEDRGLNHEDLRSGSKTGKKAYEANPLGKITVSLYSESSDDPIVSVTQEAPQGLEIQVVDNKDGYGYTLVANHPEAKEQYLHWDSEDFLSAPLILQGKGS